MLEPALASRCQELWGIALPSADAAESTSESCAGAQVLVRHASFAALRSSLGSLEGIRPASLAWLDFFEDLEPTLRELLSPNRGLFNLQVPAVRAEAVRAHCVSSPEAGRHAAKLLQELKKLEFELSKKAEADTFLCGQSPSAIDLVGAILLIDAFRFALPARLHKIQPLERVLQWLRACHASTKLEGELVLCSWSETDESTFEQSVLKEYQRTVNGHTNGHQLARPCATVNGHTNCHQPASSSQSDPWQNAMLDPWARGLDKAKAERPDQAQLQTAIRPPQRRDVEPFVAKQNGMHTAGNRQVEDPWRNCGKKAGLSEKLIKSGGGLHDLLIAFGNASLAYAASELGFVFPWPVESSSSRTCGRARGFNRAECIRRSVHRKLQDQVISLNLSDEQLMKLGQVHFKEQPRYLQSLLRGCPETPRPSRRFWPPDLPSAASQQNDDFADSFEEIEKPFWWKDDYESLCFDLQCTAEEALTSGAPPMKQWWDVEKIAESDNYVAFSKPAGMFVVTDERGLWEESPTNFIHVAHRRVDMPSKNEPSQRGICHRLDSHTSGVQIFGKSWKAFRHFVVQNGCHRMQKEYIALVEGRLGGSEGPFNGVVDVPLFKWQDYERREFGSIVCTGRGSPAVTKYQVLRHWRVPAEGRLAFWGKERWFTLVQLRILTGRTHQIRLHMAFLGHPLVGDIKYNSARFEQDCALVPRIFLHCLRMEFQDMDGETLLAASDLCPDLQTVLCQLESLSAKETAGEAETNVSSRADRINFASGFGKFLQLSVKSRPPVPNSEPQAKQIIRHFCKHCQEFEFAERTLVTRGKKSALFWQMKRRGSQTDPKPETPVAEAEAEAKAKAPRSWGPDVLWVPTELKNMDAPQQDFAEEQVPTELVRNIVAEQQSPAEEQVQT